jgi:hypothetical protein
MLCKAVVWLRSGNATGSATPSRPCRPEACVLCCHARLGAAVSRHMLTCAGVRLLDLRSSRLGLAMHDSPHAAAVRECALLSLGLVYGIPWLYARQCVEVRGVSMPWKDLSRRSQICKAMSWFCPARLFATSKPFWACWADKASADAQRQLGCHRGTTIGRIPLASCKTQIMKRDPDLRLPLHLNTFEKPHGNVWPLRARRYLCCRFRSWISRRTTKSWRTSHRRQLVVAPCTLLRDSHAHRSTSLLDVVMLCGVVLILDERAPLRNPSCPSKCLNCCRGNTMVYSPKP